MVATINRLAPYFGGREVPVRESRKLMTLPDVPELAVAETIPGGVGTLEEHRGGWFPSRRKTMSRLFDAYERSVRWAQHADRTHNDFLDSIILAGLETDGVDMAREDRKGIARDFIDRLQLRKLVQIGKEPLADIATESEQEAHRQLQYRVAATKNRVAHWLLDRLDHLVKAEAIGQIAFLSPEVCRFYFYTFGFKQGQPRLSRSWEDGTTRYTEYEIQRTMTHDVHYHELVNVTVDGLDARVRKPRRIKEFIRTAPSWLVPHLRIVHGKEVFRHTERRVIHTNTITKTETETVAHYDPAITLGRYVLAGWEP